MHTLISPLRACMKFYASIWIRSTFALLATLAGLVAPHAVEAQSDFASPYSIFGPGTLINRQSVVQAGFGGSGVALADPYHLNFLNPAASAFGLDPVFEVSGMGSFSTFKTTDEHFDNNRFMFNNIGMNLPIKRNVWGLNLGLSATTNVGYNVVVNEDGGEDIGAYQTEYSGNGGLNQFYVGSSYKVFNRVDSASNVTALALGVNYNFDFGVMEGLRRFHFIDDLNSMGVEAREKLVVRGNNLEGGIQFQTNLIKRTENNPRFLKLLAGFSTALGVDMGVKRDVHIFTIKYVNPDVISSADTLMRADGVDGTMTMPARYRVGFALDYFSIQRRRVRFSMDYSAEKWSDYAVSSSDRGTGSTFRDSESIAAGVEYTPEVGSKEFFKAMRYRVGFNREASNLEFDGERLTDVGMSFGLSLPINLKRALTHSTLNLAGRYGVYGTTDNGLIQEEYIHVYVGFSFTPHFRNRWFVQPKYD